MKESTTTRFEVGMPVVLINNDVIIHTTIKSIDTTTDGGGAMYPIEIEYQINPEYETGSLFTEEGYMYFEHKMPCLFTLPEYEALKKLTDSFVDGTFGATAKRQEMVLNPNPKPSAVVKFEPQGNEMVLYGGMECKVIGIEPLSGLSVSPKWSSNYTLEMPNGMTSEVKGSNLEPVIGYLYQNGFCVPLLKEQTDIEQPETTDLLDEQGKPVYFSDGMEVGSLAYGKGKVTDIDVDNGNICASFEGKSDYWHTFDGRSFTGGNQTLFPIYQYNAIQLPKLKPIQVAKPKADVISLPSWFKDSVHLENSHVCSFIQHQGIDTESAFDVLISEFDIKASECGFSYCTVKSVGDCEKALCLDFTHQNKYYSLCIEIGDTESKAAIFESHYSKNGKDISEKLC